MNEKQREELSYIKNTINNAIENDEQRRRFNEFNWGIYEKRPDARGVLPFEDGWYNYEVSDHANPMFRGPLSLDSAIYVIGGFYLGMRNLEKYDDMSEEDFDLYCDNMYSSFEEIEDKIAKKKK